jgi:hypothetical protein
MSGTTPTPPTPPTPPVTPPTPPVIPPVKPVAPSARLETALEYAVQMQHTETPDQVVTRAISYAQFLTGNWEKFGIVQITVVDGGQGYSTAPTVVFSDGSAQAAATVTNGVVTSIAVKKPGVYAVPPTITITGGGGSGASAVATLAEPVTP